MAAVSYFAQSLWRMQQPCREGAAPSPRPWGLDSDGLRGAASLLQPAQRGAERIFLRVGERPGEIIRSGA